MSTEAANKALQTDSHKAFEADNGQASLHVPRKDRPGAPKLTESDIARFWSKVSKSDGCWLWTAAISTGGYGAFYAHGRTLVASRVALFLHTGMWDATRHACHHCDTPLCVRPVHLYYGTDAENARDSNMRGKRAFADGQRRISRRHILIAADEMLVALKAVGSYLVPRVEIPPNGRVGRLEILPMVRAAIASAEGK